MGIKLGKWSQFWLGIAGGVLAISVASEIAKGIASFGGGPAFFKTLTYIGGFQWLNDFQTFITGMAAVGAAALSIRELRRQIRASNNAVQLQIDNAKAMENERKDARYAANRAVLPLTLSSISQYAEINAGILESLWAQSVSGALPKTVAIPEFEKLPSQSIAALKEMIETVAPGDRPAFNKLLVAIQVENSKLVGLHQSQRKATMITSSNLEAYILGQAAIYAHTAQFFSFGRSMSDQVPHRISKSQVASALFLVGVYDIRDELVERYHLESNDAWDPYFRHSH